MWQFFLVWSAKLLYVVPAPATNQIPDNPEYSEFQREKTQALCKREFAVNAITPFHHTACTRPWYVWMVIANAAGRSGEVCAHLHPLI